MGNSRTVGELVPLCGGILRLASQAEAEASADELIVYDRAVPVPVYWMEFERGEHRVRIDTLPALAIELSRCGCTTALFDAIAAERNVGGAFAAMVGLMLNLGRVVTTWLFEPLAAALAIDFRDWLPRLNNNILHFTALTVPDGLGYIVSAVDVDLSTMDVSIRRTGPFPP